MKFLQLKDNNNCVIDIEKILYFNMSKDGRTLNIRFQDELNVEEFYYRNPEILTEDFISIKNA